MLLARPMSRLHISQGISLRPHAEIRVACNQRHCRGTKCIVGIGEGIVRKCQDANCGDGNDCLHFVDSHVRTYEDELAFGRLIEWDIKFGSGSALEPVTVSTVFQNSHRSLA